MLFGRGSERGKVALEIVGWAAAASLVLAVAGYVVIAKPGQAKTAKLTAEQQAYVQAVATQQSSAYLMAVSTQEAARVDEYLRAAVAANDAKSKAATAPVRRSPTPILSVALEPSAPHVTQPVQPSPPATPPPPTSAAPQPAGNALSDAQCQAAAQQLELLQLLYPGAQGDNATKKAQIVNDFNTRCDRWIQATGWNLVDPQCHPVPAPGCNPNPLFGSQPGAPVKPQPTIAPVGTLHCYWSAPDPVAGGSSSLHCSGATGGFDCTGSSSRDMYGFVDSTFNCSAPGISFDCTGSTSKDDYGFVNSTLNCSGPGIAFTCRGSGSYIDCS